MTGSDDIKGAVRRHYADLVRSGSSCCGPATSACCGQAAPAEIAQAVGYTPSDLQAVPDGANLVSRTSLTRVMTRPIFRKMTKSESSHARYSGTKQTGENGHED